MPLAMSLAAPVATSMNTTRPSAGASSENKPDELRYRFPLESTDASFGQLILLPDIVCRNVCTVWKVGLSFATYPARWHNTQYPPLGIRLIDVGPQPSACHTVLRSPLLAIKTIRCRGISATSKPSSINCGPSG